jgi:hypothetical protein
LRRFEFGIGFDDSGALVLMRYQEPNAAEKTSASTSVNREAAQQ